MQQSNRLHIIPLNQNQLTDYLHNLQKLEFELTLRHTPIEITGDLRDAFEYSILPHSTDSNPDRLFFTLWIIIDISINMMVGGVLFTGPPNGTGEIEIGYGINDPFKQKGYAAEMLGMMVNWAFEQKDVKFVTAKTNHDNFASHKTLIKNGFTTVSKGETEWLWEREKD